MYEQIESYSANETTKQASVFSRDEISRFLNEASNDDRYWLCRKVVAILCYLGRIKMTDIRDITHDQVTRGSQGFVVNFITEKKQNKR